MSTNETGVRKQNIDSWHLVFSYIKNWKAYKSLIFCYMGCIAYLILSARLENVGKVPFIHGYSCHRLTIKLQTSAWLACTFFVNNYSLMRPLSDVPNMPVSCSAPSLGQLAVPFPEVYEWPEICYSTLNLRQEPEDCTFIRYSTCAEIGMKRKRPQRQFQPEWGVPPKSEVATAYGWRNKIKTDNWFICLSLVIRTALLATFWPQITAGHFCL